MMETFIVKNIKCEGCVSAIREGLMSLPGVTSVEVDREKGEVRVEGNVPRQVIAEKLRALGYPEAP